MVLDRHPLWLDALEELLDQTGLTVVVKTTSPKHALQAIAEANTTLFVAEYEALSEDDLEQLRLFSSEHPNVRTIILGAFSEPGCIANAFASGASVYCVKTAERSDLRAAVRQAFHSSIYLARTASHPREEATRPVADEAVDQASLTRREVEILRLVAEGHSNSGVARLLWVTEQTVKFHLSNVYRKLNVANRTEAARWAHLHGLLAPGSSTETAA